MNTLTKLTILIVVLAAVAGLFFVFKNKQNPIIILRTSEGDIALELFLDKTPKTAGNFLKLSREGFFDGTKFHRVIQGFVIQGGDPNSK
ncbi:MAG: peptidylprolyl isomerase, partial [Patescibacteria group bacterium]